MLIAHVFVVSAWATTVTATFQNQLTTSVASIEVSAPGESAWTALSASAVAAGSSVSVSMTSGVWDLRLVDASGAELVVLHNVDLTATRTIAFTE